MHVVQYVIVIYERKQEFNGIFANSSHQESPDRQQSNLAGGRMLLASWTPNISDSSKMKIWNFVCFADFAFISLDDVFCADHAFESPDPTLSKWFTQILNLMIDDPINGYKIEITNHFFERWKKNPPKWYDINLSKIDIPEGQTRMRNTDILTDNEFEKFVVEFVDSIHYVKIKDPPHFWRPFINLFCWKKWNAVNTQNFPKEISLNGVTTVVCNWAHL